LETKRKSEMEEVDKIILLTLKQIGCDIPSEIQMLKELTVEMVVSSVAKGLEAINKEKVYESRLPQEMSSRYRVCTALAKACTENGYRGDIGYHQFLYPSESETRKIFVWLVEAIPKMDKSQEQESVGSAALFQRSVSYEVASRLKQVWTPPAFLNNGLYKGPNQTWHYRAVETHHEFISVPVSFPSGTGDLTVKITKEEKRYNELYLPFVSQQPSVRKEVASSLLTNNNREFVANMEWEQEWNKQGLGSGLSKEDYKNKKKQKLLSRFNEQMKSAVQRASREDGDSLEKLVDIYGKGVAVSSSRFANQVKFVEAEAPVGDTEETLAKKREEEINNLRDRVSDLTASINKMESEMRSYETNIKQLEGKLQEEQLKTKDLEAVYKLKKRTYDLLNDPEGNIQRMKQEIEDTSKKMLELAAQWETKRVPMIETYRTLREKKSSKLGESKRQLEKIKEFRLQMKELADDARSKNDFHKQLLDEYEKLPKDVQRSQYTERIMEIVRNIQKQNVEISKVLQDTRQVQKEISMSIETLNRTYAAADELIFREAKTNEFNKKSYKLLVGIHETCAKISDTTGETGQITNTSKELEDKIDQLTADKTSAKLEKIMSDNEQVKSENKEIIQKIKKSQLGV